MGPMPRDNRDNRDNRVINRVNRIINRVNSIINKANKVISRVNRTINRETLSLGAEPITENPTYFSGKLPALPQLEVYQYLLLKYHQIFELLNSCSTPLRANS